MNNKTTLKEFLDFVTKLSDMEMLEVAEGLLLDIVKIENMKQEIEKLEEGLTAGKRVAFWMDAMCLDRDEVDLAVNKITGRKRFLKDMEERAKLNEAPEVKPEDNSGCGAEGCEPETCCGAKIDSEADA